MHLLLVSARHHPDHGGIGTYVTRLTEQAAAAGWTIELLTRPGPDLPPAARVHTIETPDHADGFAARVPGLRRIERIRPYRHGLWSLAVARWLRDHEGDADAIEFVDCQAEGFVALTSAAVRRRWAGVPMIVGGHTPMFIGEAFDGTDPGRLGRSIYFGWERAALGHADGVLVPTRGLGRRLPGVAMGLLPFPLGARGGAPPGALSAAGTRRIVAVGTLQPRKGFDVWARSLEAVVVSRPDVEAMLIGADTPTGPGGTSMGEAIHAAAAPSVRSRLHRIGPLAHAEVIEHIETAAVVVVPSRFESFSYVAAEAIARGRPVVLAAGVGLGELVPSVPGVADDDVRALADAQAAVLDDPTGAAAAAQRARAELLTVCDPRRHFARRARFLRALAGRPARATDGAESIDVMQSFLDDVDRREEALREAGTAPTQCVGREVPA